VLTRLRQLKSKLRDALDEVKSESQERLGALVKTGGRAPLQRVDEADLPVVARLMIEIRSDGTHTVAKGAMEESVDGERVAIRAEGGTPLELAASLAKTLFTLPVLARQTVRAIEAGRIQAGRRSPSSNRARASTTAPIDNDPSEHGPDLQERDKS
jgi:hypothetical protein